MAILNNFNQISVSDGGGSARSTSNVTKSAMNFYGQTSSGSATSGIEKIFRCPDNYIYIYHTDTLVLIPTYPDTITDSMGNNFVPTDILSRSAPVQTYISSGPRTVQISLALHRDMMYQINHDYQWNGYSKQTRLNIDAINDEDYIDKLVRELQSIAVPKYVDSSKMVNPPQVAVRMGEDVFIRGIVNGEVSVTYGGTILRTNKYSNVDIAFAVTEIDPYDADTVSQLGSYRGISQTLNRRIYKS